MRQACLAVVLALAAGCSAGGDNKAIPTTTTAPSPATHASTPQARAAQVCRLAVPDPAKLVSSYPTTVGDIRNVTIGSTAPSRTQAFPSRTAADFGAWCWTRRSGNNFDVYKVTPGIHAVLAAHLPDFNPRNAHGAPAIP